ncbi:MAG TPA: biopolymer transporter ExbD [Polyangiaceae bacterium]|jgi:biopolymer transport protein ExbD|nr:biopolymer transporter ExbD [Polyangiaceae bacterium]
MPIQSPTRRLMHHVGLEFVAKKVSGGGKRATSASLSLTSMIDFLVVTVVFLLMTFSASGETPIAAGLTIPKAENTLDMVDAPIVAVVGSQILVDGAPAGNTRAVEEGDRMQRIDELFNILKAKRELWKQTHPNKDFPGVVMLQIDQNIKAVIVKSVFQTAAFAGFPNVSFMVNNLPKSHNN